MVALMAIAAFAWAEATIENSGNQGTSDTAINGKSYTLDGKFIAGKGGVQQGDMPDKGVKLRSNSGPVKFMVNAGYKITGFEFWGCGNTSTPLVIKSVTVDDGGNLLSSEVTLPAKETDGKSGHFVLSDIGAENNITITFADGTTAQFVGTWKVTYEQTAVIAQEITGVTLNGAALSDTDLGTLKSTKALTIDGTNLNGVGLLGVTLSSGGTTVSKTFDGTSAIYTFTINATDQYTVTVNNVVKTYSLQGIAVGYKKGETEAGGANTNTITMDGISFAMVNDTKAFQYGSGKVTLGENDYVPLKLSTGSAVNVTFPEGKKATKVIVYGWSANGNGKIAEMKESAESEKSVDVANDIYYATNTASDIYPSVYEYELDNWESLYFNPGGSASQPFVVMDFVFADETGGDEPTIGSHWEKATSIAVGDVLLLTSEGTAGTTTWSKELKEFSSNIGQVEDYTDTPKGLQPLTVEEGNKSETFAFKNADGKYLAANSSNQLPVIDELNDNSSWTVTWEDDIPKIANVAITNRVLQYNSGSPRFACYTSAQKAVTLWKKVAGAAPATDVATPEISGTTPFVGSTMVTITCETEGANIYYTTDGTDPTDQSTKYTMAFELTASATVKAIAYDNAGASSEIASKEFVATPGVATIAALNALKNGTTFAYTGEALVVAKAANENKTYVYIKDETGSSLIYDADASKTEAAVVGKTIAANWTGKVSIFKNLFEAVPDAALSVKDGDAVEVTYPEAQLSDVKADNVNQVVELKGVTYTLDEKALTISQGQAEAAGYNQFGLEIAAPVEGKTYSIVGAIGRYNDTPQFWPISIEEEKPAPLYVIGDISTGGWVRTAMIELGFNEKTQAYEYSFATEKAVNFAFATYQMTEEEANADPNWDSFNANYRYAIGDGDVNASGYVDGDAVQLVKGTNNGTIKLPAGAYKISVTKDFMMTITSNAKLEYDAVYVAGNGTEGSAWMNGVTWDPLAEANKMTKVEGKDDVWEIVFKDVPAGEDYLFKFIPSGEWSANEETKWSVNFGGEFFAYGIETPAEFNSGNNIAFKTIAEKQDITLRIDLSQYNTSTQTGAKFTVIASKDKTAFIVAGCVGQKGAGDDDLLFGKAWDATAEANAMSFDKDSGLYTKTYYGIDFEGAADIYCKVVVNGNKWIPEGDNRWCEIPGAGKYNITVTYNVETGEVTITAAAIIDIVINPQDINDGDITTALNNKIESIGEGNLVGDITINLAEGGAYSVTAPIVANRGLIINGNGASIDASGLDANFIEWNKKPIVPTVTSGQFVITDNILIQGITVTGLKKAAFFDNGKSYSFVNFTIDKCVFQWDTQENVGLNFASSMAMNLNITNSTMYSTAAGTANFIAMSGKRPWQTTGYEEETGKFTCSHNTFYNIAKGKQFMNTNTLKGQKYLYEFNSNIFVNVSNKKIYGNMTNNKNQLTTDGLNTYMWDGVFFAETNYNGDEGLQTDPGFKDAANGDFALADASAQAKAEGGQTGDPRWGTWDAGYLITIADDIKNGTVKTDVSYAHEGDVVTITATAAKKYMLYQYSVVGATSNQVVEVAEDGTFKMPADGVIVSAAFIRLPEDIIVNPEDITDGDVKAGVDAKIAALGEDGRVRNITINLAKDDEYTISGSIEAPANLIINGNGASIDASALTAPMISMKMPEIPVIDATTNEAGAVIAYPIDNILVKEVTVENLAQTFIKSNSLYLVKDLTVENSVIGFKGAVKKTYFDFSGQTGGNYINLTVNNSTLWADATTQWQNGGFLTTQSSKKLNQMGIADADLSQTTTITNSTIYNVANGKTTSTPVQNSQVWMKYVVKNNVIANSGKEGQFVTGLNAVNSGKAENWEVDGNVFNWNKNDIQETEASKIAGEMTNSLACRVLFSDVEKPDFGGIIVLAPGTEAPETLPGDPRWSLSVLNGNTITVQTSNGHGTASAQYPYAIEGEEVGLTIKPEDGYEVESIVILDADGYVIGLVTGDTFTMPGQDVVIYVGFKKTATGIDAIENDADFEEGEWYTINGVRVDQPTKKGLYIHNGKKIVIK